MSNLTIIKCDNIGKLDMGKSCIRFKRIDKIPLELIGELCSKISAESYVSIYEANKPKSNIMVVTTR